MKTRELPPLQAKPFIHIDFWCLRHGRTHDCFASLDRSSAYRHDSPLIAFNGAMFHHHIPCDSSWWESKHNGLRRPILFTMMEDSFLEFRPFVVIIFLTKKVFSIQLNVFTKTETWRMTQSPRHAVPHFSPTHSYASHLPHFIFLPCPEKTGRYPITCSFEVTSQKISLLLGISRKISILAGEKQNTTPKACAFRAVFCFSPAKISTFSRNSS